MPFPILELPLELRNMIYREIVLSHEDENKMRKGFQWLSEYEEVKEAKASRRNDAANFLLTNKQLNFEASRILLEERYYRNFITWRTVDAPVTTVADDEVPLRHSSPFELLWTSRNLEIIMPEPLNYRPYGTEDLDFATAGDDHDAKNTGVFCNDLASHGRRLKNVVVYLPCECSREDPSWLGPLRAGRDWQRCFPTERLLRHLAPLRRLRARRLRFVHKCKSPVIAEIQPILRNLVGTVQSSNPVEPLSKDQSDWCSLREEARQKGLRGCIRWPLHGALMNMSSWFTDSRLFDKQGKAFQAQYQDQLQYLRALLKEHTWEEDLMLSVTGPLLSELD
ncbi:MAG: hypothetical protein L6R38_008743 [Xanthoria sp. 2 TBL-2021]|nr:MAG: hypothetical protein L6R38_008743 [Xanthoria sp. 2 TBL-2021]